MAAFQQRRHAPTAAQQHDRAGSEVGSLQDDGRSTSDLADDDGAVLLFASQAASWSVVRPVRSERTTSYSSQVSGISEVASPTEDERGGNDDDDEFESSIGSPASFRQGSLLPAHSGDGVFFRSASSLVQSDGTTTRTTTDRGEGEIALFPSVYADFHDSSDDAVTRSSAFSDYSHIDDRGPTRRRIVSSQGSEAAISTGSEWALTEAALSTIPHRHSLAGYQHNLVRDDVEEGSAGLTSGSEAEDAEEGRVARDLPSLRETACEDAAQQRQRELDEEEEWAQSPYALSAGFLAPSRRARRPPPPSAAAGAAAPHHPTLLLPIGNLSLRSLSPNSSLRSRRSSSSLGAGAAAAAAAAHGFKRRHRHSGTGRSSTSQKRSANGGGISLSGQAVVLERIAREEEDRARRMLAIVEERKELVRLKEAEARLLFGYAVRNYMSIEPSTLALLAEADSTLNADATPVPSRAQSPTLHGPEALLARTRNEARFASTAATTVRNGDPASDDVSDAETETENDAEAPTWLTHTVAPTPARKGTPTRSHSTSDMTNLPAWSTVNPPRLLRRSSSFSNGLPLPEPLSSRHLSHEERIMLDSTSSSSPAAHIAGDATSTTTTSPWGGDADSFELALSYWKRMWRRLRGSSSNSAPTVAAAAIPFGLASAVEAGVPLSTTPTPTTRRSPNTATELLLVPEARVGLRV